MESLRQSHLLRNSEHTPFICDLLHDLPLLPVDPIPKLTHTHIYIYIKQPTCLFEPRCVCCTNLGSMICWMSEARPVVRWDVSCGEKKLRKEKGEPRSRQKTYPVLSVLTVRQYAQDLAARGSTRDRRTCNGHVRAVCSASPSVPSRATRTHV